MLDEVLEQAEAQAITVLRAAGGQLEADLPFAPFVDALGITPAAADHRSAGIAALLTGAVPTSAPVDPGGDSAQMRLQVVQAILDLVEELCAGGPVAVAVEDAHWLDEASLAVVDRLGRRLAHVSSSVTVVAAAGDDTSRRHEVVGEPGWVEGGRRSAPALGVPSTVASRTMAALTQNEQGGGKRPQFE